jgi:hypothetical protein
VRDSFSYLPIRLILVFAASTQAGCDTDAGTGLGGSGSQSAAAGNASGSHSGAGSSDAGSGASGSSGAAGSSGSAGAAGSSGSPGSSGASGTAGSSGSSEAAGPSGASGAAGMAGSSGASGAAGSSGSSGAADAGAGDGSALDSGLADGSLPLVYTTENTGADCTVATTFPAFSALQSVSNLPDPFLLASGTRMTSRDQWRCRRAEIASQIQYWGSGPKGAPPTTEKATFSGGTLTVVVTKGSA